jgi:hypothetical protein
MAQPRQERDDTTSHGLKPSRNLQRSTYAMIDQQLEQEFETLRSKVRELQEYL